MNTSYGKYEIGVLGLGVMGRSLALNLHRNVKRVIGYDSKPNLPQNFPVTVANSVVESPRIIL